ncbi:P-type conjugative transfer protein TrbG [Erythrobacter sp. QSSC1-22B]|uniref:P-type conjugative transfer protein TrbG n=1 Tax=Erythrobacter sp. QSSC1-22B TaxID=1860125 RepID=UPI000805F6F6|nr:P-type conjugative transfer protein TrbG [Erythrobacter sp. QSSC1-22B]OBX17720.1 P-type conjugative transfer protein TrbG [Erythrobacter sp. QSSC1-22B]
MRHSYSALPLALAIALLVTGCATYKPPEITYDSDVPPLPAPPPPVVEQAPVPVHTPPAWMPSRGGENARTPDTRVINANAAARVEPRREGYYNAIQVFPYSEGALYQVYAAPGQITTIVLEAGERLIGDGPIAAGDTARWIIGDTPSGSGREQRVHILVKPTRPDISTNLVISTDRRIYLVELHANEASYMPSVAWAYPPQQFTSGPPALAEAVIPPAAQRRYRYGLEGDTPPWRPQTVFDDGRRVYVVFPRGIVQGEMPPLFVIGSDGAAQLVNTRVHRNILIVDRLFAAAELRLGGEDQQRVRIVRADGVRSSPSRATAEDRSNDR